MEKNEKWRDIKGYEGRYQVSDFGRVKSLARVLRNNRPIPERILKNCFDKHYYHVILHCDNTRKRVCLIHRLVADAFLPNPHGLPVVNHIDGNKLNNHVSNLEWCTYAENTQHMYATGLAIGQDGGNHRAVDAYKVDGTFVGTFMSEALAARTLNVNTGNLFQVLKGINKQVKGFTFKYHL